jgi:colanic acid/amylovoran biosynthesis glycosyltransferase
LVCEELDILSKYVELDLIMSKKILHCNETYAKIGENYIFDQVQNDKDFEGLLVSEKLINSSYDPVDESNRIFLRKSFSSVFVEKILQRLSLNIFEKIYLYILHNFIIYKLKIYLPQISIIHAHFGHIAYKYVGLAKQLNVPMIVTFYGVDASACAIDKYWIKRLKIVFEYASVVIVLCESAKKSLISIGCEENKLVIWDIGIPIKNYLYNKPTPNNNNSGVKFLIVARFVEKKGYDVLLEAFYKLSLVKPNITLTIVGYGPLKEALQDKIKSLKLTNTNLIDSSKISNFFEVFKENLITHDVFLMPSIIASNGDDEGGPPIVITNAMASGLPVIATPIGGIERAIIDDKTGFLVKSGDSESLYEKMLYVCENKELWSTVSNSARSLIEKNFDKEKQLNKINQIYNSLVS